MKEKTCVFIGRGLCFGMRKELLEKEIIRLIELGVEEFLCGGKGYFDHLCASTVRKLKQRYPHIKCYLAIPYPKNLSRDKDSYSRYDDVLFFIYKSPPPKSKTAERSRMMVRQAAYALCYVNLPWGDAAKTLDYAEKRGLEIVNIAVM